jgi:hypothetical protein
MHARLGKPALIERTSDSVVIQSGAIARKVGFSERPPVALTSGKFPKLPFSRGFNAEDFSSPDYFLFTGTPTDYSFPTGMSRTAPRSIIWVPLGLVLALMVFTTLEVSGVLAPRGFSILCLVAMITAGVAFYLVFQEHVFTALIDWGKTPIQ